MTKQVRKKHDMSKLVVNAATKEWLLGLPTTPSELVKVGRFALRKAAEALRVYEHSTKPEGLLTLTNYMSLSTPDQAKLVAGELKRWRKSNA